MFACSYVFVYTLLYFHYMDWEIEFSFLIFFQSQKVKTIYSKNMYTFSSFQSMSQFIFIFLKKIEVYHLYIQPIQQGHLNIFM